MYVLLYRVRFYSPTSTKGHIMRITCMTNDSAGQFHARDYSMSVTNQSMALIEAHAKEVFSTLGDDVEVSVHYCASESKKPSGTYYVVTGIHKGE